MSEIGANYRNELKIMNKTYKVILSACFAASSILHASGQMTIDTIPLGGNTWRNPSGVIPGIIAEDENEPQPQGGRVNNEGIADWTDQGVWFTTWCRISGKGKVHLWLNLSVPEGESRISVCLQSGDKRKDDKPLTGLTAAVKELNVTGSQLKRYDAGTWTISDTGYHAIQIRGISKTGYSFAAIRHIELERQSLNASVNYVRNNEGNYFYWGRRGPSVHLNYPLPSNVHAEWFYNEITVPEGQDIQGSYFMANGFAQGYFGMQVNSPTERHILFSVWSPFQTDDPKSIPDSQKIIMVRKGEGVHTGEFGNEGSGGQSYFNYMWKAGNTYRFLLRAQPLQGNYTQFTAWFYAPGQGQWMLIASFRRPQLNTWLTNLHSFLENFDPGQGYLQRYVLFNHQWVRDDQGKWISLNKARFTGDNTARKGYRMDYGGGVRNGAFYLRNCGFFDDYTALNTWWERPAEPRESLPDVDLTKLP